MPQPPALDGREVLEVDPGGEADQERFQTQQPRGYGREERRGHEPRGFGPSQQPGVLRQQCSDGDAYRQRSGELERGDACHRQLQRPGARQRLGAEQHGREQDRHRHVLCDRHGEQ